MSGAGRIAAQALAWLGACACLAQADVIVVKAPTDPAGEAELNDSLNEDLPGQPQILEKTRSGNTFFIRGRIEGFTEPYTWDEPGKTRGAPQGALLFRPRIQGGPLAPKTVQVEVGLIERIHHEVDHPIDLALLFGDRGEPDSLGWKASLKQGLGDEADKLPGLGSLDASGVDLLAEDELPMRGGFFWYLDQQAPTTAELDPDQAARERAMAERAKLLAAARETDMSVFLALPPAEIARKLLDGLAVLEHYPHLTEPEDALGGRAAFARAIKACLSFLCRLVTVELPDPPNLDGLDEAAAASELQAWAITRRSRAYAMGHGGRNARSAVIDTLERAGSGRIDVLNDVIYDPASGQPRLAFAWSSQDLRDHSSSLPALSQEDQDRYFRYYEPAFRQVPARPMQAPESIPLSPTERALTALQFIGDEPSWWVIHPHFDDAYSLMSAIVGLAPLMTRTGQLLPDLRNVDGVPANQFASDPPPLSAYESLIDGSPRKRLCAAEGGVAVRTLTLLLHDPMVGARKSVIDAMRPALRGRFERLVRDATEVFGTHVLRLSNMGHYGQQQFINLALVFAGESGSLQAERDVVRNLFSIATHSRAPRPGPAPVSPFGMGPGTGNADLSGLGWGSQADDDAEPAPDSKQMAIETLMILANMGDEDDPPAVADWVIRGFHEIDLRRALSVATPGEETLMRILERFDELGQQGDDRVAARVAGGVGRRLNAHMATATDEGQAMLEEARAALAQAESSGTDAELAAARRRLQEVERRVRGLESMSPHGQ